MSFTIPSNAPFSGAQKMWLKGYLDGLNATLIPNTNVPDASAIPLTGGVPVTIIWGSQTGTAETLSKKLAKSLTAKGHSPTVKDMAEVSPADLAEIENLLIITSTYGDGEPPDNAAEFHAALHEESKATFPLMKYSVLALGDSSYPDFCKCGHDFDQRFSALGANCLAPIVECDVDFDEPFAAWLNQLSSALTAA